MDSGSSLDRPIPDALRQSLEHLLALTRKHNPKAETAFTELQRDLEQAGFRVEATCLANAFEAMDFKTAALQLEPILLKPQAMQSET